MQCADPRLLLPALHPAGLGGLPRLELDVRQSVRRPAAADRAGSPAQNVPVFRTLPLFMPTVAFVTVWWTIGFNILLFIAGLRNISPEIYEAAALDGASRWRQFTPHHLAADLAGDGAGPHHPADRCSSRSSTRSTCSAMAAGRTPPWAWCSMIYRSAFQKNHGGYGATVAVVLFVMIVIFSVLQFQLLRARGEQMSTVATTTAAGESSARARASAASSRRWISSGSSLPS